ncbi:MAG TPA: site-specific integrase [Rhodanobacteraceae bacterium]
MATIVATKAGGWKAVVRQARYGVPLRVKTFRLKTDAEAWARRTEAAIAGGDARDAAPEDTTTLHDALDRYQRSVLPQMRGAQKEASVLDIVRGDMLSRRRLTRITSKDIAALRDRWSRAVEPGTVRRRFHTLSHVFTVARKEWGITRLANPVADVAMPKEPPGRDRRVSEQELDAIQAAATSQAMRDFVTLAVETAMRRGELFAARWEHVDTTARTLWVPKSKNGEARTVPLSTVAVGTLEKIRSKHTEARLFPRWTSVEAISVSFLRTVRRARKAYLVECRMAGTAPEPHVLTGIHLHDLRHEATSRLAQVPGLSVHMLAKITGHKTLAMLMRYYNPTPAEIAKMLP